MVAFHNSPILPAFEEFIARLHGKSLICSPFISRGPIERLVTIVGRRKAQDSLRLLVLTDLSVRNIVAGVTDIASLVFLCERFPHSTVRHLPQVHAKVYIADEGYALVTSANFTDGGASRNLEYGVSIREPELVSRVSTDIHNYAALGAEITLARMRNLAQRANRLRELVAEEQRSIDAKVRAATIELERETEDELLRARVANRSIHAIFADTILFLLGQRAMTTVELHGRIREIHPDLCDDLVDRVIDGEHFGKLWKHQVRTAQQYLKRAGLITNDPALGLWARTSSV